MMALLAVLTFKVSAVLLLALIGALLLRRSSAAARHWVLAVGVVSAVALPALHVLPTPPVARMAPVGPLLLDALPPGPYVRFTEPAEPVDADGVGSVVALPPGGSRPGRSRPAAAAVVSGDVVGRLAVTIWLLGAFGGLGVLLVGLARLRWLRASSSRVTDGRWHRLCADLSRSCGLNRGVDLLLGPRPGLVATWGWRRPAVMLPASASGWSAERMRVVLLHELAHARRGDWLLQLAAEGLRCVWWFNPLAWMVRARLRRESEHAADDLVLTRGVPAATCATHLVELAREVREHRRTWLPAPAMARSSNLERRVSAMLNPRTNRRPMTGFARFGSLGVLVPVSIVVAALQIGPVSASRSAESTGSAVDPEPPAEPSSGRVTEFVPAAAAPAALQERVQVGPVSASRSAESTGSAVELEPPAEPSSGRVTEFVPVGDAPAAVEERVQVGPVPVLGSAESTANAVAPEPPAEPSSGRVAEFVPVGDAPAAVEERVQVGPVPVLGSVESTANAVAPEPPAEPSSERITELVARATGLPEEQQTGPDGQQALLGGSGRPTGRPEAGAGIQGAVVEEATIGPTGEMDDIEVVRSIPGHDEADERRGAPGAHASEADADEVLATRRASTLERELNAAAAFSPPAPGEVFRDCDVCPEMVVLPEGDVALGRFEVTLEEYRVFVAAVPDVADTRCTVPRRRESWRAPGWLQTGRHPVACVSWRDAVAYVSWLSQETGQEYRLPTDSEWDRGAAGSPKGCNRFFTSPELGTCVVGSYPPSAAGIFGMLGNVSELTSDYWDGDRNRRVVRGPSWRTPDWLLGRPDLRRWVGTERRNRWLGFRVARTLP